MHGDYLYTNSISYASQVRILDVHPRKRKKEVRILDSLCTTDYSTELMSGESQTFVTPQNNLQKSYCFGIWSTAFGSQDYSTYLFISLSNWNG